MLCGAAPHCSRRIPAFLLFSCFLPACVQVGPDSAEIMQGMGVAVKMGVTKQQLDSVVGIHPSGALPSRPSPRFAPLFFYPELPPFLWTVLSSCC